MGTMQHNKTGDIIGLNLKIQCRDKFQIKRGASNLFRSFFMRRQVFGLRTRKSKKQWLIAPGRESRQNYHAPRASFLPATTSINLSEGPLIINQFGVASSPLARWRNNGKNQTWWGPRTSRFRAIKPDDSMLLLVARRVASSIIKVNGLLPQQNIQYTLIKSTPHYFVSKFLVKAHSLYMCMHAPIS